MTLKPSESDEEIKGFSYVNQGVVVLLTVPVVALGLFWEKILMVADGAKVFIQ